MRLFHTVLLLLMTSCAFAQELDPDLKSSIAYGNNAAAGGRVAVTDALLYYEIYGKGEPLLLLHAKGQSIKAFEKQIIVLAEKYKVIAVDTRGQGKSTNTSTGDLSYNLLAEDMKTLLDSLHIPKTNILGWSDGGNTGMIMAFKYPAYVNKLITMGANTMLLQKPHISLENLHSIHAPVLVMAGENDIVPDKHTRYIAKEIPNAKLLIFKGTTHDAPVKVVAEFNLAVMRFLTINNVDVRKMIDFAPEKFN